jgi:hypothetical protein
MAVNYASALNCNPSNNQLPFYTSQQQPSPTDSAIPTPQNISPTSPRMDTCLKYQLPNQVRQLRPPKSPLYVPAVLRPTERPGRQGPLTPPKSLHGSLDSLNEAGFGGGTGRGGAPLFDFALPEEELGEVTGPPNRDHWKVGSRTVEFLYASSSDRATTSAISRLTAGVDNRVPRCCMTHGPEFVENAGKLLSSRDSC